MGADGAHCQLLMEQKKRPVVAFAYYKCQREVCIDAFSLLRVSDKEPAYLLLTKRE